MTNPDRSLPGLLAAALCAAAATGCHTHLQEGPDEERDRDAASAAGAHAPPADAGAAPAQSGVARAGDRCDEEGARACTSRDSRLPLACSEGRWQAQAPCDQDERCDIAPGEHRGMCEATTTAQAPRDAGERDAGERDAGEPQAECAQDLDCSSPGQCQAPDGARCVMGECVYAALADGIPCLDADACTRDEVCNAGTCQGTVFECGDTSRLIDISSGDQQTCALDGSGALYCWGALYDAPSGTAQHRPARFGTQHWRSVAVGAFHACGIRHDGTLWCWGENVAGVLGDANLEQSPEPVQVGGESDWLRVAAGGSHSCGIRSGGRLICWGRNPWGMAGDCAAQPPTAECGAWRAVSANFYSISALRDDGALFRMPDIVMPPQDGGPVGPLQQVGTESWRAIAAGVRSFDVCGIRSDGTLSCAGDDQLSDTPVGSERDWIALAVRDHGCAIRADGSLWCWGRNDMGQSDPDAGDGADVQLSRIGSELGWSHVAVGWSMSCAIREGRGYCWGQDPSGVGVLGSAVDASKPVFAPIEL